MNCREMKFVQVINGTVEIQSQAMLPESLLGITTLLCLGIAGMMWSGTTEA